MMFLAEQAPKHNVMVEVGTWKGRSCSILCERSKPGAKVFAVDTWRGSHDEAATLHKQGRDDRAGLMIEMLENLRPWINSGKLEIIPFDSATVSSVWGRLFPNPVIDFIWIDSDHRTESVRKEIRQWLPLMRPGGMMSGHDGKWESVQAALNLELPGWQTSLDPNDHAWFYAVPDAAPSQ
jgi:SAM-dependent methyltransferase